MFKTLLIKNGVLSVVEISEDYHDIQKQIGCDCFTVPFNLDGKRKGSTIGVFADDEALLKQNPQVCVVLDESFIKGGYPLFGDGVMLVGATAQGNTRSLTDDEIARFKLSAAPRIVRSQGITVVGHVLTDLQHAEAKA